jgi:uncharacterized protein YcfJ
MNKLIPVSALIMPLMSACAASADHRGDVYSSSEYTDYAEVIDVEPLVRDVHISDPRQECWQEEVYYQDHGPADRGNTAARMVLGGLAGVVIGHQFGHGDDRDTNALAGGIIGSGLGYGLGGHRPRYDGVDYEERCHVVNDYYTEERVDGYRVTYVYHGETFTTQLPYDPGDRLRVRVDVDPAQY